MCPCFSFLFCNKHSYLLTGNFWYIQAPHIFNYFSTKDSMFFTKSPLSTLLLLCSNSGLPVSYHSRSSCLVPLEVFLPRITRGLLASYHSRSSCLISLEVFLPRITRGLLASYHWRSSCLVSLEVFLPPITCDTLISHLTEVPYTNSHQTLTQNERLHSGGNSDFYLQWFL